MSGVLHKIELIIRYEKLLLGLKLEVNLIDTTIKISIVEKSN